MDVLDSSGIERLDLVRNETIEVIIAVEGSIMDDIENN